MDIKNPPFTVHHCWPTMELNCFVCHGSGPKTFISALKDKLNNKYEKKNNWYFLFPFTLVIANVSIYFGDRKSIYLLWLPQKYLFTFVTAKASIYFGPKSIYLFWLGQACLCTFMQPKVKHMYK